MDSSSPYYARYDMRYKQVRELGLPAFKNQGCLQKDIAVLEAFLEWLGLDDTMRRVIEFGCGDGYLAVHLAKKGFRVVAFDYSEAAIIGCRALARKSGVDVDFRTGNALSIDWAQDEQFDLGVSNNVLQMFATSADREKHVAEMYRVLRPGAFLFLNLPANTDVPEELRSLEEHRKHREFLCDVKGTVEVGGVEKEVAWPQVASWGLNIYSAATYLRDRGFHLHYIHWEKGRGYGHGLTMYLERR